MTEARAISDGVDLKALIEAAKKANRGPWEVYTEEHPWVLPERELLGKTMPAASGTHKERWIVTSWEHPQAHAKMPIVGGSSGIGLNGQPVHMVHIDDADATFIALANPSTVAAMAEELMALRAETERQRAALAVYGVWAIDVSTIGELADLEQSMKKAGVTLQQVGVWTSLSEDKPHGK